MKIFLVGTAVNADNPANFCDLMCAEVVGLVEVDRIEKPVVICSSRELWIVEEITDAVILDASGMVESRGCKNWTECLDNRGNFGLRKFKLEELKKHLGIMIPI